MSGKNWELTRGCLSHLFYIFIALPIFTTPNMRQMYYIGLIGVFLLSIYTIMIHEYLSISKNFLFMISLYIIFIIYCGFSLTWTSSTEIAIIKFFDLLIVPIALISYPQISVMKKGDINTVLTLIFYISMIVSTLIIYSSALLGDPLTIFNTTHINIGRSIGLGLPIGIYYLSNKHMNSITVVTGLFVILVSLVMIESRGPALAAISSSILVGFYCISTRMGLYRSILSALSILLLMITSWFFGMFTTLSSDIDLGDFSVLVSGKLGSSAELRIEYYYNALDMWANSPLIGSGLSGYFAQYGTFPHNIVLEIGAELGLIGVILFGSFIISGYKSIRAQSRSTLGIVLLAMIVFALVNASVSSSLPGQRLLFFALGLAVSPALFR
ncbi:O-antigen ligase family protein [Haloplanus halophilus]|uniref:O-antigen ligase family protein n=1 Tax=Haloplanus halophilus TaxID=2949993 RepID=UPI00203F1E0B|nr:O-antigen ligase family protein [Haloplanus sp. GDY1]